ncbi:MAG: monovalent cation/H(+) antiporter subunit G [Euryarchaeota archaeon]|nr:MAG: multicomponent Na+:H+ antiporter subunit G [ANME-2 cluster archaeon]MEA1865482.1 monovalent cation/H(+) antiporter subunit G [Euryarchaeota archaeon]
MSDTTMITNILTVMLLLVGVFFMLAGTIGFLRFPDFYSRMHATGKCDTLGEGLMLVALIVYEGVTFVSVKILFLIAFILLANPTSTHAIAKAAYDVGLEPWRSFDSEEVEWMNTGNTGNTDEGRAGEDGGEVE